MVRFDDVFNLESGVCYYNFNPHHRHVYITDYFGVGNNCVYRVRLRGIRLAYGGLPLGAPYIKVRKRGGYTYAEKER